MFLIAFILFLGIFIVYWFVQTFGPILGTIFSIVFYLLMWWMSVDPVAEKRLHSEHWTSPEMNDHWEEVDRKQKNGEDLGWW